MCQFNAPWISNNFYHLIWSIFNGIIFYQLVALGSHVWRCTVKWPQKKTSTVFWDYILDKLIYCSELFIDVKLMNWTLRSILLLKLLLWGHPRGNRKWLLSRDWLLNRGLLEISVSVVETSRDLNTNVLGIFWLLLYLKETFWSLCCM